MKPISSSAAPAAIGSNSQALVGREFVHFKGKRYKLLAIATHSETLEPFAVYQALYGEHGTWGRPLVMFFENIECDGYRGPRFRLVEDQRMSMREEAK